MYLPGVPCHVIQRGNNREACFFTQQDYLFYLSCLGDACDRYIELNPVAANMVKHPGDYPWSSYRHNAFDETNTIITQHDLYRCLGKAEEERRSRYRALFETSLAKEDVHAIRTAARFSMPIGDGRFKAQIERALGSSIGQAKRGRPVGKRREGGG
jgi:putative transposase